MQRMCKVCGDWHDLDQPWPVKCYRQSDRGSGPAVISDAMEPIKHMATGRILDSKSQFRSDTKASGCIELGSEPIKQRTPIKLDSGQRREAIRKTIYDLRNGR